MGELIIKPEEMKELIDNWYVEQLNSDCPPIHEVIALASQRATLKEVGKLITKDPDRKWNENYIIPAKVVESWLRGELTEAK